MQNVIQELKELPGWFIKHPLTEKIVKDNQQQINDRRRLAYSQLITLRSEQNEGIKILNYKILKTEKALQVAREEVKRAGQEHDAAKHEKTANSMNFSQTVNQFENLLRETSAPLIDETIKIFKDKLDDLRRDGIKQQDYPGKKNMFTEKRQPFSYSNIETVKIAMEYLRAAIATAEGLKLEVLSDQELTAKLVKLKDGIPSTAEMILYQQE